MGTRVVIHGPLPQENMAVILRRAHLAVLPSFFEGLPLVVLEALGAGCRVVATALPGVMEMLAGFQGKAVSLVPRPRLKSQDQPYEEDEEVFVWELAKALDTQVQAAQSQPNLALTEVSEVLNYFSWPAVFARVERVYQTILKLPDAP
jgi:glycosyltransferase involved in cell wall biosynthesis